MTDDPVLMLECDPISKIWHSLEKLVVDGSFDTGWGLSTFCDHFKKSKFCNVRYLQLYTIASKAMIE